MNLSDTSFQQRLAQLSQQRLSPLKDSKVYQLPMWPESARGIPNPVLRSALFAAVQGKKERFFNVSY